MNIKAKDVIVYVTLPQVLPRLKGLFLSGFSYVTFLMAQIYAMARILPQNHPYLQPENMGRYGFVNVMSEAHRNLVYSRKNIDQIAIFFILMLGIVMFFAQVALLLYSSIVMPAFAFSLFDTTDPTKDLAFNILDHVFGIPDIYCSITNPTNCTEYSTQNALPMPFHSALHGLFKFYSNGLLIVAVLIFVYFVVVVVFETATTGTPFGKRFQNVWVPIRLILALGLLMPAQYGLNAGQYIVLYAAKYGGGFASTGWNDFLAGLQGHEMFSTNWSNSLTGTGERVNYLILPEAPKISGLVEAMTLVHTCAYAYHLQNASRTNVTSQSGNYPNYAADYTAGTEGAFKVQPFFVKQPTKAMEALDGDSMTGMTNVTANANRRMLLDAGTTYQDALGFYYGGDILIRFGEAKKDTDGNDEYQEELGHVSPVCGDIRLKISDLTNAGKGAAAGGAEAMQQYYFEMVRDLWFTNVAMRQFARAFVAKQLNKSQIQTTGFCTGTDGDGNLIVATTPKGSVPDQATCESPDSSKGLPTVEWKSAMDSELSVALKLKIVAAWEQYIKTSLNIGMGSDVLAYGWGGAGIWYSKIAEVNGGWIDSVSSVPYLDQYPAVMEEVRAARKKIDESFDYYNQFSLTVKAKSPEDPPQRVYISGGHQELEGIAQVLSNVFVYWNLDPNNKNADETGTKKATGLDIVRDAIMMLMGLEGLLNMRGANQHMHPLAQLIALGKGLVNSAVLTVAASSGTAFLGGFVGVLSKQSMVSPAFLQASSDMLFSIAFMGLTAGVMLFYVLPFLPFLYFFFAVASWVKGIFEAMVGVPLWALAHMRIDGEGLPGEAAQNGYYLILEIFLRPIMTVIALVAAITIFSAQVRILNIIWDLVVANLSGFHGGSTDILLMESSYDVSIDRGPIDDFFFTLVYTVVCYMMANASFKLIDKIPDNIMRWIGGSVSSYGDIDQESIEKLNQYASSGSLTIGQQAAGAIRETAGSAGGALGSIVKGQGGKAE